MVTGLIFDLDNTLVDTSIALTARKMRVWQEVYSLIPRFTLYEGIRELCESIKDKNYKTCIVTTSPKRYAEKVVKYFDLPFPNIVGYHDARIKPSPAAMYMALQLMNTQPHETISFGDKGDDILSSNRAGIPSAACQWGCLDTSELMSVPSTYCFKTPVEVAEFLRQDL